MWGLGDLRIWIWWVVGTVKDRKLIDGHPPDLALLISEGLSASSWAPFGFLACQAIPVWSSTEGRD